MKIAYVGNFSQQHCTEVHLAATLEDLGHEVVRIQETPQRETHNWVNQVIGSDLFLYTRTWGNMVILSDLEVIRAHSIPSASYHLDLYVGLSRKYLHEGKTLDEVLQEDPFWRTDFVFTPDGGPKSAEVFKRNGVNHYYMKPGVFKQECYLATPNGKTHSDDGSRWDKEIDVLFVGGGARPGARNGYGHPEWPYRNKLIGWLEDTYKHKFHKYGWPQKTVRNDELNQLYANSKVVVGDSVCIGFNHEYYWSDRVYETLGRGGFLIHPYIKGMEEEFKDEEYLVYYEFGNFKQLQELIDYYLEHPEERERIRLAGHEFVKNYATYNDRLTRMLEIVTGKKTGIPTVLNDRPSITEQKLSTKPLKISLGAGTEIEQDDDSVWINTDIVRLPGIDIVHNLMQYPWPFEDNSADYIKAKDIIEHMASHLPDGRNSIIAFIEECHRILKPGGTLWIQTPGWDADFLWIDPTHVRGFDIRSFDFFDPETDFGRSTGFYSEAKFEVKATKLENKNLQFSMVKR